MAELATTRLSSKGQVVIAVNELHEKFANVAVGPILDLIVVNSELCAPARLPRPT